MLIPQSVISKLNYHQLRLVIYLMCKRGKPGQMLKNQGENPIRLKTLISLANLGLIKVVDFNKGVIYFKFSNKFEKRKISVSTGLYLD
jgi:hypothetical protein